MGVIDLSGLHWASEARWGGIPVALKGNASVTLTVDGVDQDIWIDAIVPARGQFSAAFGLDPPPRDVVLRQMRHS